jgi:c-di-GMP-binding flagellar brake protein YcgR
MSSNENNRNEPSGHERRSSPRVPLVRFIWYKVIKEEQQANEESREGISRMCDLSRTGVGIYVTQPIDAGKRVFLEVATTKENLSALGQVVNTRPTDDGLYRVGIHFIAIPPNDRLALDNLLGRDEQA